MANEPPVLNYHTPGSDSARRRFRPEAVVGGFFMGIGAIALAFVLIATYPAKALESRERWIWVLSIVGIVGVTAKWGTTMQRQPKWRGFGVGLTIGLIFALISSCVMSLGSVFH